MLGFQFCFSGISILRFVFEGTTVERLRLTVR